MIRLVYQIQVFHVEEQGEGVRGRLGWLNAKLISWTWLYRQEVFSKEVYVASFLRKSNLVMFYRLGWKEEKLRIGEQMRWVSKYGWSDWEEKKQRWLWAAPVMMGDRFLSLIGWYKWIDHDVAHRHQPLREKYEALWEMVG